MQTTDSVDFDVVLFGEVVLELDDVDAGDRLSLSLLDHGAVAEANLAPAAVQRARSERRLRGFFLVDLDAPARLFVHPQIAVAHLRTALKDRLRPFIEWRVLLNSKVITY